MAMMVRCWESNILLDASIVIDLVIVRAVCCWMCFQVCAFAFAFCGCLDEWGACIGCHIVLYCVLYSMHGTSLSCLLSLRHALTPAVHTWTHKQCSGKKPSDTKHCKKLQQTNTQKKIQPISGNIQCDFKNKHQGPFPTKGVTWPPTRYTFRSMASQQCLSIRNHSNLGDVWQLYA